MHNIISDGPTNGIVNMSILVEIMDSYHYI